MNAISVAVASVWAARPAAAEAEKERIARGKMEAEAGKKRQQDEAKRAAKAGKL
jgi:hypothetical protein